MALCAVCKRTDVLLRPDGRLEWHGRPHATQDGGRMACPGSNDLPGYHVHRCPCGARWDEHVATEPNPG